MRWLIGGLLGLLLLLQYRLWFAEGGLAEANRLQVQLEEAEAENAELKKQLLQISLYRSLYQVFFQVKQLNSP